MGAAAMLLATMRLLIMCLTTYVVILGTSGAPPSAEELAHCPKTCGDVNISYPYGVGNGCFRPGGDFELTCDDTTKPPKLFLGNTTEIHDIYADGYVNASIIFNIDTTPGVLGTYNRSWEAPGRSLYIEEGRIKLLVIGCGIEVNMFHANSDESLGYCSSTCHGIAVMQKEAVGMSCSGIGCCTITFHTTISAFRFSVAQTEAAQQLPSLFANATIKAFLADVDAYVGPSDQYNFSITDLLARNIDASTIGTSTYYSLSTVIADHPSCATARLDAKSYACGHYSCSDVPNQGYRCKCPNRMSDSNNPYVLDGCKEEYEPTQNRQDCSRSCGNMTIPFPFGLQEECSANRKFLLNCTSKQAFIGGSFTQYQVTNISLDQGLLFVNFSQHEEAYSDLVEITRDDDLGGGVEFWIDEFNDFDVSQHYGIWKWFVTNVTCEKAKKSSDYACISANGECTGVTHGHVHLGYRCKCSTGYEGNPECATTNQEDTVALVALMAHLLIQQEGNALPPSNIILSWRGIQKKIRRAYFHKNKGLLLEQLISCDDSVAYKTKIFCLDELEKATNNFDSTRILGSGGHGTVYKGILSDQRVVAIKKSKIVEQSEIDQFVNEVAMLSQIIHRNVVKLFGCCLESEVPLLVYEFISNGTLYDLLHGNLQSKCLLTWWNRIRIALEAASALAYLHCAASVPIFHRDVKSANILLDDNFTTKVSDFGASRSVSIDETHVVTIVQGTFGYLDPEYYHTGQLNEKSDVYSFGVILIELLTRKRPIFLNSIGEKQNLCHHFLQRQQNNTTTEIVDAQVLEEADQWEIDEIASLAEICLRLRGEERPTMKEVELRLQLLRSKVAKKKNRVEVSRENEIDPLLLYTPSSSSVNPRDFNSASHDDATRCYTMEQELVSWTNLPR
uniref:Protein kinase domain-containing protein n=1 Tax=Oryza nivara TaxID=4536 RepID=A0A0E0IUT4_ORYNI